MRQMPRLLFVLMFLPLVSSPERVVGMQRDSQPVTGRNATVDSTGLTITTVAAHLDVPWEIVWGPDNWIWFTEQSGTVSRLNPETGEQKLLLRIIPDVYRHRTLGLLCMALHPDMKNFPYVFLNYIYLKGKDLRSRWVRYTYDGSSLREPLTLLEVPADIGHNGSRIVFAPDGKLMIATGDADHRNEEANGGNAQDLQSYSGKILRLNIDGTIPDDNPFPGSPVWALGFRVPQGLVYASNGRLYSAEHGNVNDDEVNLVLKGTNYGYPNVLGACDHPREKEYCIQHAVKEPLMAWTPTIAPAGLEYYSGSAIPEWRNSLLLATLKTQSLRVLKLNEAGDAITGEKVYFERRFGRIRDICVSPEGDVYLATSNRDWNPAEGFPMESDDRIIRISANRKGEGMTAARPAPGTNETSRLATGRPLAPGAALYNSYCASCHKSDGSGVPGTFPPLKATSPVVMDKAALVKVVLQGLSGPRNVAGVQYDMQMPGFSFLSDREVAEVVTYVRTTFGQKKELVTETEVAGLRKKLRD